MIFLRYHVLFSSFAKWLKCEHERIHPDVVSLCLGCTLACCNKARGLLCEECTAGFQWKKLPHISSFRVRAGHGPAAKKTARKYPLLIWHLGFQGHAQICLIMSLIFTRTSLEFTHPDSYLYPFSPHGQQIREFLIYQLICELCQ